jgi:hypothetical protein
MLPQSPLRDALIATTPFHSFIFRIDIDIDIDVDKQCLSFFILLGRHRTHFVPTGQP